MVAALKLHDVLALSKCSREPDGSHRGFCPRADEAHHLDRGKRGFQKLGQVGFGRSGCTKAGSVLGRASYSLGHLGIGVAEDHWPPRTHVVDVLIAVCVPKFRSPRANDDPRRSTHIAKAAYGGVPAAGKEFFGRFMT